MVDKTGERDPAADGVARRGDFRNEGDLLLPAAGGGTQDKEAEAGRMTHPGVIGFETEPEQAPIRDFLVFCAAVCQTAAGEGRDERHRRGARHSQAGAGGDAGRAHQGAQVQVSYQVHRCRAVSFTSSLHHQLVWRSVTM